MNETIALLQRRRSLAPSAMTGPGPSAAETETLLRIASRERAGRIALELKLADDPALDEAGRAAERTRFSHAPLVIAVVSRAAPHAKIPEWEQQLSAGAACMNLVIGAHALGFVAGWLTGWCAYDRRFGAAIGLAEHERVAGFVHIGRPRLVIEDRPRPALGEIVTVFAA
jgi:nitroreductase